MTLGLPRARAILRFPRCASAALLLLAGGDASAGDSNVDPAVRFAWSENAGWTDWWSAGGGTAGVRVEAAPSGAGRLAGHAWAENAGWIDLGDGTPADGSSYANVDASDFGVNLDFATGLLSGHAWGENVGWIVFDPSVASGPARLDLTTHRFEGHAWSETLGWIDLGASLAAYDPAEDLGSALAGSGGLAPELRYLGLMSSGQSHVVVLRDARTFATAALLAGVTEAPTPFKGGLLVPVPVLLTVVLATDGEGKLVLPLASGTGSVPVDLVVQFAVVDGGAPAGVSLSNAVRVTYLP